MKKHVFGLALGAILALTANLAMSQSGDAAPPPPPGGWHHGPGNPTEMAAHLAKRLNLSAEQQSQVAALLTTEQAQHQALEQNQTITHQQFLAQSKTLHEETHTKIEALLNETQKQEFEQMQAHMRHGPPPSGEAPPEQ